MPDACPRRRSCRSPLGSAYLAYRCPLCRWRPLRLLTCALLSDTLMIHVVTVGIYIAGWDMNSGCPSMSLFIMTMYTVCTSYFSSGISYVTFSYAPRLFDRSISSATALIQSTRFVRSDVAWPLTGQALGLRKGAANRGCNLILCNCAPMPNALELTWKCLRPYCPSVSQGSLSIRERRETETELDRTE